MKKVFKSLVVGALAIPCAFAFTGCGDNSVNVDTSGNYKAVESTTSYSEINTLIEDGSLDFAGIRFTVTSKMSSAEISSESKINGTAVFTETGVEFSVTINGSAIVAGVNADVNMSMYMHENVLYVQSGNQKLKIDLSAGSSQDNPFAQYLYMIPTNETITNLLDAIEDYVSVSEKSEVNDIVKYHLKSENTASGNNECWIIVKEGKFDGFKVNTEMEEQGMTISGSVNVETYTGTVDMPSFDGYVDYSSMLGM